MPATLSDLVCTRSQRSAYRHVALFYAGLDGFVDGIAQFIDAGVARGEPTLVVVGAAKIDALRRKLGPSAGAVEFADMADVGANPARIIPAWRDFVDAHPGRRLRGVGEPIFPERGPVELAECQHHERLLNPALADSDLLLVCPYDTAALPADVLAEARHSHPRVRDAGGERPSGAYDAAQIASGLLAEPLPEPPASHQALSFTGQTLFQVRALLRQTAARIGLVEERAEDLVLAAAEFASNSVRHGDGRGKLRVWTEERVLVCEFHNRGAIDDPLVDRRRPRPDELGGWGLWLANQVCDLVQLRSLGDGVVARLHMRV
jgi:anti-sigma regulatory factor (Ser/Thr protein kinase)